MGFTEGFMRSQAFTQKTQGKCTMAKITVATGGLWLAVMSSYMTDIKKTVYSSLCSALTDSLRKTRLILLVLLLVGIYGLSRTPFLSGKGSFSDAGLFQFYSFLRLLPPTTLHAHCIQRNSIMFFGVNF